MTFVCLRCNGVIPANMPVALVLKGTLENLNASDGSLPFQRSGDVPRGLCQECLSDIETGLDRSAQIVLEEKDERIKELEEELEGLRDKGTVVAAGDSFTVAP